MRARYAPVVIVAVALGWLVPDAGDLSFIRSAEARPKIHAHHKKEKSHRSIRKGSRGKSMAKHAATKPKPVLAKLSLTPHPLVVEALSPSTTSSVRLPDLPLPAPPVFPPDLQPPTREQQMEKLRIGLERLAKTMAGPEDYMDQLKLGLEQRAKAMNASPNAFPPDRQP